ncbi:uncharacterized protein LOC120734636 isoform X1 [Simochromis diagramma]|uniref:uncharacterized protein LOC120734636 isoform X1 n=1 Tax=Simochromis diagramma TaxID=43689 RepID=UPI001A7E8C10|nr:uncharacterized protein LOC120734636 isoform X1 [Simochromis diagramma]
MSCSPSMRCFFFLVFLPLWAVVRSDESLTGSFGETLKLDTPDTQLIGEYEIIWSHVQGGTTTVLIHYDAGEWRKNATDKHQLDEKTGSLIIRSLTANDSGLYQRQLFNETEGIVKEFNLTVVGPKPTTPPNNGIPWIPWIVGGLVLIVFAVLLCAVLLFKCREQIKGQFERKKRFRVRYAACDREDPGRSSGQENATQDTAVQIQLCNGPPTDVQRY